MNYGAILSQAWEIAWKYKSMWILGLLAAGGPNFDWNYGTETDAVVWSQDSLAITAAMVYAGLVLGLVVFCMTVIGTGGMIDANNQVLRGGQYRLRESLSVGIDRFFPMAGLSILSFVIVAVAMAVLAGIGALLYLVTPILLYLSLIFLIPLAIAIVFSSVVIFSLAERALIIRRVAIMEALQEGYWLFRNRLGQCIVFALVLLLIAIGLSIVAFMIMTPLAGSFLLGAKASTTGLVVALVLGLPIVIAVALVIWGFIATFLNTAVTIFYLRLLEPAQDVPAMPGGPEPTPERGDV